MIRNCAAKPVATAAGRAATRAKSASESVIPMPSMITARPTTIAGPRNHVNHAGSTSASPQATSTHTGNAFARSSRMRFIVCSRASDTDPRASARGFY